MTVSPKAVETSNYGNVCKALFMYLFLCGMKAV